jgi:enoyl-CoA hydratase/carnithine racemase
MDTILVERDGAIATVILNRPEKLNALTVEMFHELRRHVVDLQSDTSVSCVVRVIAAVHGHCGKR